MPHSLDRYRAGSSRPTCAPVPPNPSMCYLTLGSQTLRKSAGSSVIIRRLSDTGTHLSFPCLFKKFDSKFRSTATVRSAVTLEWSYVGVWAIVITLAICLGLSAVALCLSELPDEFKAFIFRAPRREQL